MMPSIAGPRRSPFDRQSAPRGFILTMVVMIIAALFSFVLIRETLSGLTQLTQTNTRRLSVATAYAVEGCANDAVLQVRRDAGYRGSSMVAEGVTCIVDVTGEGNVRTISVEGSVGAQYHAVTVETTLIPFGVIRWE